MAAHLASGSAKVGSAWFNGGCGRCCGGDELKPRRLLTGLKVALRAGGLSPADAFGAMLSFYHSQRVQGCDADAEGDMLLFQWGTYDWGSGSAFEIGLARQLIFDDRNPLVRLLTRTEHRAMWQLHLQFRFVPTDDLGRLGSGNRWCSAPDGVDAFEAYLHDTAAFRAVAGRTDVRPEIWFEPV